MPPAAVAKPTKTKPTPVKAVKPAAKAATETKPPKAPAAKPIASKPTTTAAKPVPVEKPVAKAAVEKKAEVAVKKAVEKKHTPAPKPEPVTKADKPEINKETAVAPKTVKKELPTVTDKPVVANKPPPPQKPTPAKVTNIEVPEVTAAPAKQDMQTKVTAPVATTKPIKIEKKEPAAEPTQKTAPAAKPETKAAVSAKTDAANSKPIAVTPAEKPAVMQKYPPDPKPVAKPAPAIEPGWSVPADTKPAPATKKAEPKPEPQENKPTPDDRDGDGVANTIDLCPNTGENKQVNQMGCLANKEIELQGVNFRFNSAELLKSSSITLDQVVAVLKANPAMKIEIGGHTDSAGAAKHNKKLSQQRADSVKKYLLEKGVNKSAVTAKGYGEENPIADNKTRQGRAKNRRVTLKSLD